MSIKIYRFLRRFNLKLFFILGVWFAESSGQIGMGEKGVAQGVQTYVGFVPINDSTFIQYPVSSTQLPVIIGQVEGRDIAGDFVAIQTMIAFVHACFIPLRYGLEEGSIYERKWETIIPVVATDIVGGLLGGHIGGMVCRTWISKDEPEIRAFFKSMVAGLFAGAIWGATTSVAWVIASRSYRGKPNSGDYDLEMYGSIGAGVVFSSIIHPVIVILRY